MSACKVFISHATADKNFAIKLQDALQAHDMEAWIDHRELTAGEVLPEKIKTAIQEAQFFILLLSMAAINSDWVAAESDWALQRGEDITLIPLLLEGVKPAAAKRFLGGKELKCIEVGHNGLQGSMVAILAALEVRLPDHDPAITPTAPPVEELILQLSQATLVGEVGKQRGEAQAMLIYRPSAGGPPVESPDYTFRAPLGPIEAEELAWYLERFPRWPGEAFRGRAQAVENALPRWGEAIYQAALDQPAALTARSAWERAASHHQRRLTIQIKPGMASAEAQLFTLPWELLHNGTGFLFDGISPVRVRRRRPNYKEKKALLTQPPLRVLLLSPRPEDKQAGYIDHRVTAQPVAEVLAGLGDLARLTILEEPTLEALVEALRQANRAEEPYHVVHFDGHGVYLEKQGLGALCFEKAGQEEKLEDRASHIVTATELRGALQQLRVPLFVLEACQTSQAKLKAEASVAAALLDQGAAAVVAMSHSVLVATAAAFMTVFYQKLAEGERIGEAMLAGQRHLYRHKYRGDYLGAGALELHDWFVPVLYQEEGDPALVMQVPSKMTKAVVKKQQDAHLGE
ncbi:MAG: CHAT domain-containing protein [Magnetococcales bacterium]|nr:CHAT domain-containing protein [Magnetococcales bacterium]